MSESFSFTELRRISIKFCNLYSIGEYSDDMISELWLTQREAKKRFNELSSKGNYQRGFKQFCYGYFKYFILNYRKRFFCGGKNIDGNLSSKAVFLRGFLRDFHIDNFNFISDGDADADGRFE